MNAFQVTWKSMQHRRLSVVLNVMAIFISCLLLVGVLKLQEAVKSSFERTISETDLIVGAATGPVNLLLYAMFRIGDPLANIDYSVYTSLKADPRVRAAIPLSMGDSHRGYRVLATTEDYFNHYRLGDSGLELAGGTVAEFSTRLDTVVLGSDVARELGYSLGERITISHGIDEVSFEEHTDVLFEITGILAPTGTAVDRSLHISLEGLEAVHGGWSNLEQVSAGVSVADDEVQKYLHQDPQQISVMLLSLHSKLEVFEVQRHINEIPGYQAILPGVAFGQFWRIVEVSDTVLTVILWLVFVCTLIGLVCAMLNTVHYRVREMAIFRALGSSPTFIAVLLLYEALICVVFSSVVAYGVALSLLFGFQDRIQKTWGVFLDRASLWSFEWELMVALVVLGLCAGLIPAFMAYRRSLNQSLSQYT